MSFERIAEILSVDEVRVYHGSKGVMVCVRSGDDERVSTIDNEVLEKSRGLDDKRPHNQRRLEVIAERLVFLADPIDVGRFRKSRADATARATAVKPAREEQLGRWVSWADVGGFDRPRDGALVQQQLTKSEPLVPTFVPAPPDPIDASPTETMQSRFHAVMAELRCL